MYDTFPSDSLSVHLRSISCLTQSSPGSMRKYISESMKRKRRRRRRSRGELEFREAEEEEEEEEKEGENQVKQTCFCFSVGFCASR